MAHRQAYAALRRTIVKHALLVMLVGLLSGFCWAFALLGHIQISPLPIPFPEGFPGEPDRWRAVHIGCLMNGIMALALAGILPVFNLTERALKWIKLGVLAAIWGNVIFYLTGVFAPNHGLTLGDNTLGPGNFPGGLGFVAAMLGAFGLIMVICILLMAKAREEG